jgi:hypothetical protein
MSFIQKVLMALIVPSGPTGLNGLNTANQSTLGNASFNSILGAGAPPKAPVAPSNLEDVEAQKTYTKALEKYQQEFQNYHSTMLRQINQRLVLMQRQLSQQKSSTTSTSINPSEGSGYAGGSAGVGGILN